MNILKSNFEIDFKYSKNIVFPIEFPNTISCNQTHINHLFLLSAIKFIEQKKASNAFCFSFLDKDLKTYLHEIILK